MEVYVYGIFICVVDDLVEVMGVEIGIFKFEVLWICVGFDEIVGVFCICMFGYIEFFYVYFDVIYFNVCNGIGQVVLMVVIVVSGIVVDGLCEIFGFDVGDSEDEIFWCGFLILFKGCGFGGVWLVISDQYVGLVKVLKCCFQGVGYQCCWVYFVCNLFVYVFKDKVDMVVSMF